MKVSEHVQVRKANRPVVLAPVQKPSNPPQFVDGYYTNREVVVLLLQNPASATGQRRAVLAEAVASNLLQLFLIPRSCS